MPPTCAVFIATSLDGFIARPDGAIDWLERLNATVPVGHRRLYVDGGRTIQSFLAAGLIAELTVTVVPVLLGAGIRLFGAHAADQADVPLRLLSSQAYPFGFVQSRYAVGA